MSFHRYATIHHRQLMRPFRGRSARRSRRRRPAGGARLARSPDPARMRFDLRSFPMLSHVKSPALKTHWNCRPNRPLVFDGRRIKMKAQGARPRAPKHAHPHRHTHTHTHTHARTHTHTHTQAQAHTQTRTHRYTRPPARAPMRVCPRARARSMCTSGYATVSRAGPGALTAGRRRRACRGSAAPAGAPWTGRST